MENSVSNKEIKCECECSNKKSCEENYPESNILIQGIKEYNKVCGCNEESGCDCFERKLIWWNGEEIKCPYCNYEFPSSWEFFPRSGPQDVSPLRITTICEECKKEFEVEQEVKITYNILIKEN